ncbi:MAG: hypothetical protein ACPLRZ_07575 [Thermovenabulum sp.]|uniref:hypothetical protein n=1 Tax=Thermovenabulum sp. TaxID=3100335 RepID=UPI003C7BF76E
MVYFVEIQDKKIVTKGFGPAKTDNQIEITKEIYEQLTSLPAEFETDAEGNIISVIPILQPEPESETQPQQLSIEDRIADLEMALATILGGAM